jgi:hypothetical protein
MRGRTVAHRVKPFGEWVQTTLTDDVRQVSIFLQDGYMGLVGRQGKRKQVRILLEEHNFVKSTQYEGSMLCTYCRYGSFKTDLQSVTCNADGHEVNEAHRIFLGQQAERHQ